MRILKIILGCIILTQVCVFASASLVSMEVETLHKTTFIESVIVGEKIIAGAVLFFGAAAGGIFLIVNNRK